MDYHATSRERIGAMHEAIMSLWHLIMHMYYRGKERDWTEFKSCVDQLFSRRSVKELNGYSSESALILGECRWADPFAIRDVVRVFSSVATSYHQGVYILSERLEYEFVAAPCGVDEDVCWQIWARLQSQGMSDLDFGARGIGPDWESVDEVSAALIVEYTLAIRRAPQEPAMPRPHLTMEARNKSRK